jgi:flavorubredoxin
MEDTVNGKATLMMMTMYGLARMMSPIQSGKTGGITVNYMVMTGIVLTIMDKIPNMNTLQVTLTTTTTDMMATMAMTMTTMMIT